MTIYQDDFWTQDQITIFEITINIPIIYQYFGV